MLCRDLSGAFIAEARYDELEAKLLAEAAEGKKEAMAARDIDAVEEVLLGSVARSPLTAAATRSQAGAPQARAAISPDLPAPLAPPGARRQFQDVAGGTPAHVASGSDPKSSMPTFPNQRTAAASPAASVGQTLPPMAPAAGEISSPPVPAPISSSGGGALPIKTASWLDS